MRLFAFSTFALIAASTASSHAQETTTNKTSAGETYMQNRQGQALYVFDQDRAIGGGPAASTCYDKCAQLWPPFAADAGAQAHGDWTTQDRKDGSKQWAYKGRPIYTFVRDSSSGKVDGNGFNGNKWHLAEP